MVLENLGCPRCSAGNLVTSPDSSYVKAHSEYQLGGKTSKYKCSSCGADNTAYWTKE